MSPHVEGRRVYVGQDTTCAKCGERIAKGAVAWKHSRRAETWRERCHADARGAVAWYRHERCAGAVPA